MLLGFGIDRPRAQAKLLSAKSSGILGNKNADEAAQKLTWKTWEKTRSTKTQNRLVGGHSSLIRQQAKLKTLKTKVKLMLQQEIPGGHKRKQVSMDGAPG